jgi:hypothetical protein
LRHAVIKFGGKNWKAISIDVRTRTHVQCLQRWNSAINPGLGKGRWKQEEDEYLRKLVNEHGIRQNTGVFDWTLIAKHWDSTLVSVRTGKQIRDRWSKILDPSLTRGPWTEEEDKRILALQREHGNSWTRIAEHLPGRIGENVKTRHKSLVRVRVQKGETSVGGLKVSQHEWKSATKNHKTEPKPPQQKHSHAPSEVRPVLPNLTLLTETVAGAAKLPAVQGGGGAAENSGGRENGVPEKVINAMFGEGELGMQVGNREGHVVVTHVTAGGAAQQLGVSPGSVLLKVQGARPMNADEVSKAAAGKRPLSIAIDAATGLMALSSTAAETRHHATDEPLATPNTVAMPKKKRKKVCTFLSPKPKPEKKKRRKSTPMIRR